MTAPPDALALAERPTIRERAEAATLSILNGYFRSSRTDIKDVGAFAERLRDFVVLGVESALNEALRSLTAEIAALKLERDEIAKAAGATFRNWEALRARVEALDGALTAWIDAGDALHNLHLNTDTPYSQLRKNYGNAQNYLASLAPKSPMPRPEIVQSAALSPTPPAEARISAEHPCPKCGGTNPRFHCNTFVSEQNSRYPFRPTDFASVAGPAEAAQRLQDRVANWMQTCFGPVIAADKVERGDRFLEEAFELLQSGGYDRERIPLLIDYVWGRSVGEPVQEVGGVMITLAAYCLAYGLDMHEAGEIEYARINTPEMIEKIRAKQAAKAKAIGASPLPIAPAESGDTKSDAPRIAAEASGTKREGEGE